MKKVIFFIFIIILIVLGIRFLISRDTWIKKKTSPSLSPLIPTLPPSPSKPRVNREELLGYCGVSSFGLCHYDTDCYISGCNAEICQSKNEQPIMSACVILDCHKKPEGIVCGCKEGECQWQKK